MPNLLGLAAGHGGADAAVRSVARAAILAVAAAGTVVVARAARLGADRDRVVLFCAVLALPWVMPWYLVWALPFVALGRPRVLVPVAVVATVWLMVGGLPQLPGILHSLRLLPDAPADRAGQPPRVRAAGAMSASVERGGPGRALRAVGVANTVITLAAFALLDHARRPAPAASALAFCAGAANSFQLNRRWTFADIPTPRGALMRFVGVQGRGAARSGRGRRAAGGRHGPISPPSAPSFPA